ncbi:diaminopimelate decarboxylase [Candidatus Enterococcus murrayae]|uniref:Diaminopimelate decarboxylase n=1 Tax=Candidatus Enterococcus murrayae TaxID=2815321 RepID=A0ABS3HJ50_9ENTE|nr:diaminopimelate decarboxylase [Enterococcus sp. MJM16]MBO0453032.1 diaminopimelate decarboxylase [Enterococcus sp. MJM16]
MEFEVQNGHLMWDGCDTVDLAEKFGTPLYVFSQTKIEEKCHELQHDFVEKYENVRVAFASKAFSTLAMLKIIQNQGFSLDVVSDGELYTAIKGAFPAEHIEMNGNNKSIEELEMAIDYGVGRIIVDSLQEVDLIAAIAKEKQKVVDILFRITPEVNVQTHSFISTGQKDSKFGIPIDESILFPQIQNAIQTAEVNFLGFHFHVGSQLFDNHAHLAAVDIALDLVKMVKERFDYTIKELNFGGGFGVRYTDADQPKPFSYFTDPMMEKVLEFCEKQQFPQPAVVIEPGRSIVAEAGISLHQIGAIKELPGLRKYVSIDGGMTDNIRPGLYEAEYTGILANKADHAAVEKVTVSGKACESTDILVKDIELPSVETSDIFATFSTGAYGYSMASNYNKLAIPAVVLTKAGQAELIVRRQTLDQIIQNEEIPSFLN